MGYSCGIFEHENSTLHEAQVAKFDRICKKLDLKEAGPCNRDRRRLGRICHACCPKLWLPGDHYNNISNNQYRYMQELFADKGLADRIRCCSRITGN